MLLLLQALSRGWTVLLHIARDGLQLVCHNSNFKGVEAAVQRLQLDARGSCFT
jgi:hypothetical protein